MHKSSASNVPNVISETKYRKKNRFLLSRIDGYTIYFFELSDSPECIPIVHVYAS